MEALKPIKRTGDQKGAHLGAPQIKNEGVPVALEPLAGVAMLVERGPVEPSQPVGVGREMGRDPIQEHADARVMTAVDQQRELFRRAEQGMRGELTERLIAPRSAERMAHDR